MQPTFIPKKIIILLHEELVERYGGSTGLRGLNLLESALEQPRITFDGAYLHDSIFKMAAAYGFHLCSNLPFIDGNKRIALVAMDVFLQRNGYQMVASEEETYKIMMKLSTSQLSKEELANWLEANTTTTE